MLVLRKLNIVVDTFKRLARKVISQLRRYLLKLYLFCLAYLNLLKLSNMLAYHIVDIQAINLTDLTLHQHLNDIAYLLDPP